MNYAFKLQSSSGVCNSVSTSKSFNSGDIVRAHCLGRIFNSTNSGVHILERRRDFSTYSQTLKLLLKKNLKANENVGKKLTCTKYARAKDFPEVIKFKEFKNSESKIKIHQLRPSQVKEFARKPGMTFETLCCHNKYVCDSSRSFDPNLFILNSDSVKYKEEDSSSTELDIQDKNKLDDFAILESFPLGSVKNFPLSKRNLDGFTKLDTEEIKKNYLSNSNNYNVQQTANVNLSQEENEAEQYIVEDLNKDFNEVKSEKELINAIDKNITIGGKTFIQYYQSYIDVAVSSNELSEALKVLSEIRKKQIWKSDFVRRNAAELCGAIMNSYGLQGDWSTVSKIRDWMKTDQIQFNYQCYAALLDCLGRTNNGSSSWHQEVVDVLQELKKMKYSINGVFTKTILSSNQRQNILNTIRKILKDFAITSTKINLNSTCNLVSDLYTKKSNLTSQVDDHCIDKCLEDLVNIQAEMEKKFSITIKPVPTKMTTFDTAGKKKIEYLENLKEKWRADLKEGFLQSSKLRKYENLRVYLNCLSLDTFVELMMEEIDILSKQSDSYSQSTILSYKILGSKVERRYETKKKAEKKALDNSIKLFQLYCDWYANPSGPALNSRQQWQMILQENVSYHPSELIHHKWPYNVTISLGTFLYDIIFRNVKLNVGNTSDPRWVPVFYRIIRFNSINEEQIKIHPKMSNLFKYVGFHNLIFETSQCPMLCPPKPWTSVVQGGYLSHTSHFYRKVVDRNSKAIDLRQIPSHKLYAAFDSLNAIQNTPWKINEPVLDVVLEVFKNGGCDKLDVAKYPENFPIKPQDKKLDPIEAMLQSKEIKKLKQDKRDRYGLWCEALYRLSLANHFRKKTFWLPYNFDFRGRLYPIPALINHLGSDTYRALLMFAKGKPLGPKGLDWLKIHTINLAGTHKKVSLEERLSYANSILPTIVDSGKNPLTGDGWWKESDEPWQTLAACMEIKNALESSSPESYVSHLPIHQDGSCNGLQHYAALGRDKEGGINVNLTNCTEPQDVYAVVTSNIEKKRIIDAENGVRIASILEGYVRRKVVKQTIMTTVYGVTLYGAKLQIAKQLNDIESFPKEHVWEASTYLTHKTFACLEEMFSSAREIQNWFTECANIITRNKKHVKWVSPLGLPILQPYSQPKKNTAFENGVKYAAWEPNKRKQRTAFPPNFIHSLDSSHLMLTALFCEQAGITFASIHDCYWTHAITIENMNKICREQFLALHSQPILKNLSDSFIKCFEGEKNKVLDEDSLDVFRKLPATGDLDLTKILKSVYFFS